MTGRDPDQPHRASTPLELLFDLAFVVSFGQAADQLAHAIAFGHASSGVTAFVFVVAATCWAWVNFSWFASAYDTDDWFYRIATMVQLAGVVVFALGIPAFFESLEDGAHVDNGVLVAGYVVMRVALIGQWLRVARQDALRRMTALRYAGFVGGAQVGWVVLALFALPTAPFIAGAAALFAVEFVGPILLERAAAGTPWHPEHIAERYGLLAIISLGEGIFGTVAAVNSLVQAVGWSVEAALVVLTGVTLTFGLWWSYFITPSATVLRRHRSRVHAWNYSHIPLYASIVATGAGLHVTAYVLEGTASASVTDAVLAVAVPVLIFIVTLIALYTLLLRTFDPFHVLLVAAAAVTLAVGVATSFAGAPLGISLVLVALSPTVIVVGYETIGHRHQADALAATSIAQQVPS